MSFLHSTLVFLHIIGLAIIIGGWLAYIRSPRVLPGQFHASLLQLLTGLALVVIAEMHLINDNPVNHMKVGIKLVVALAIVVLAFIGQKKFKENPEAADPRIAHAVGGLAVLNTIVAVYV